MTKRTEVDEEDQGPQSEHPTPQWWMEDSEVEALEFVYPDRAPTDFVISGPIANAKGPGRVFPSWSHAERWARERYGARLKGRIQEAQEGTRWAFLIAQAK